MESFTPRRCTHYVIPRPVHVVFPFNVEKTVLVARFVYCCRRYRFAASGKSSDTPFWSEYFTFHIGEGGVVRRGVAG